MQINQYKSYHLHQKFKAGSKYSSRALQNSRSQKLGMSIEQAGFLLNMSH